MSHSSTFVAASRNICLAQEWELKRVPFIFQFPATNGRGRWIISQEPVDLK